MGVGGKAWGSVYEKVCVYFVRVQNEQPLIVCVCLCVCATLYDTFVQYKKLKLYNLITLEFSYTRYTGDPLYMCKETAIHLSFILWYTNIPVYSTKVNPTTKLSTTVGLLDIYFSSTHKVILKIKTSIIK